MGCVSRPAHLPSLSAAMPGRAVPLLTLTLTCCCADMLSVTVFVTPAGTRDAGGVLQPAYLNFDAQLLGPPAPGMKVCAAPLHHPSHAAHLLTLSPPPPQPRQQMTSLHYQPHACCGSLPVHLHQNIPPPALSPKLSACCLCAGLLLHLHQHIPPPVPCPCSELLPLC